MPGQSILFFHAARNTGPTPASMAGRDGGMRVFRPFPPRTMGMPPHGAPPAGSGRRGEES
ncbi:hypothetical protein SXCC_03843 [Gluconacetobacter sp. SXCC-1]|nr:hypothetical protein SXCC_03843 [Gluconacetobacter sp. SXCC-1]